MYSADYLTFDVNGEYHGNVSLKRGVKQVIIFILLNNFEIYSNDFVLF